MQRNFIIHLAACTALAAFVSCSTALGQTVVNGDFETNPFATGWDNSDGNATAGTGFAPGSTQHAILSGTGTTGAGDDFFQDTSSGASDGVLSWWLQTTTFDTTERAFNLVFGTDAGTAGINLRLAQLDGMNATLEAFSGGSWNTLSTVGAFDESSIYYFEIDFDGFGTGDINDASYSVNWSNPNPGSATTSNTSGVVSLFQNNGQISGGTADRIQFASRSNWDDYNIDDVSLVAGTVVPSSLTATIDRLTGEITLTNPNDAVAGAVTFTGYSFTSAAGGLDASNWTSISDTYDVNGSGSPTISGDDWTELSSPTATGDLSEIDFESLAGATLNPGQSISLGVGAWTANPFEDVQLEYSLPDGSTVSAQVDFVNGATIESGDFNSDGVIDALDWGILRSNLFGDFSSLPTAQSYFNGDISGNGIVNGFDYQQFRTAFETANGVGSFEALIAAVPEPGSASLLILFALTGTLAGSRRMRTFSRNAIVPAILIAVTFSFSARKAEALVVGIDSVTLDVNNALTGVEINSTNYNGPFTIADIAQDNRGAGGLLGVATGDSVLTGTVVDPMDANQGFAFDNNVLTGVAGSTGNPEQNGGAMALYWGDNNTTGLTDNDADPDFFIFEDLGNDSVEVRAILGNGTVGESVALSTWNSVSSLGDLYGSDATPLGGGGNRTVTGVAFDFTDLLDETGAALTNGTAIRGILVGDEGSADLYEIYANIDSASVAPIPTLPLTLQVDPVDGDIRIANTDVAGSIDFAFYQVDSALGELDTVGWNSLEDQNLAAFPAGDGTGNGWEEGGLSDSDTLGEAYLLGNSSLAFGESVYLGEAVIDNVTQSENISFSYRTPEGNLVEGLVEFVNVDAPVGLAGDFNNDGSVDAADYTVWRDNLGQSDSVLNGNGDGSGTVDAGDYTLWSGNYGASSSSSSSAASAVPEPGSLGICLLGGIAMFVRRRTRRVLPVVAAVAMVAATATPAQAIIFDRDLQLGEEENGSVGATVTQSFDSSRYYVDFDGAVTNPLGAVAGNPVYADVSARPGAAVDGIGITFDGNGDYLHQRRFGNPENSAGSISPINNQPDGFSKNYTGLRNRGMQLWINPNSSASGTRQSVMHDTNQFGILISEDNTWILQSNDVEYDTEIAVNFDAWSHVSVVRELGVGTIMHLNGIGIGRTSSTYRTGDDPQVPQDTADLVLGANTAGDETTFSGGTQDFFTGTLDQVEVFTWGVSEEGPGAEPIEDHGDYNFVRDNGFARSAGLFTGVAGDINSDGFLNQSDVDDFVAGWLNESSLGFLDGTTGGRLVGDISTFPMGDLDLDGDTDFDDALLMQSALINASVSTSGLAAVFAPVPEPTSSFLMLCSLVAVGASRGARK